MKDKKSNINFNKCYYVGKHLAFMILCLYLVHAYVLTDWIRLLLVVFLDWFVLEYAIIDSLESDNGFVIRKSQLDGPFILYTTIGLIVLCIIFNYAWWNILVLVIFNALCFNQMDANDEKKIQEANEEMRSYLQKHKKNKNK